MPSLTLDKLSPNILNTQYQVRGLVYLAAQERLNEGKDVIFTSVGNPQQLGQVPLTFLRQVLALVTAPFLMDDPATRGAFPPDAIERAREYLDDITSVGAYTDSRGSIIVRQQVCDFLERRDGVGSHPNRVFLTDGASAAVRLGLQMLIRGNGFRDGILVPIPQYPLYSASIALLGGVLIPYELDEHADWGLNMQNIQCAVNRARADCVCPRGLVFINPGNPTGQVLSADELAGLIDVCHREEIALLADEVYQDNIYSDQPFVSARKVLADMGGAAAAETELLTFHTVSKGALGECGLRGGMVEVTNVCQPVVAQMYKLASINLSPNVVGQIAMGVLTTPPQPGDFSYDRWTAERAAVMASLARRAAMITDALNALPGVTCVDAGALYAFPSITLPPAAVEAARQKELAPDVLYCLELLQATGIATTPGSGFGQKEGTYHFRTTILPPEERMDEFADLIKRFHLAFLEKYRNPCRNSASAARATSQCKL